MVKQGTLEYNYCGGPKKLKIETQITQNRTQNIMKSVKE